MSMREIIRRVHIKVDKLAEIADRYDRDVLVEGLTRQVHEDLSAIMRAEKNREPPPAFKVADLAVLQRVTAIEDDMRFQKGLLDQWTNDVVFLTNKAETMGRRLDAMQHKLESRS